MYRPVHRGGGPGGNKDKSGEFLMNPKGVLLADLPTTGLKTRTVSRFQDFKISRFQYFNISIFQDFKASKREVIWDQERPKEPHSLRFG